MSEEKKEILINSIRLSVALILAIVGLFYLNEANFGVWVNFVVMGIAWLIVGYDIVYKAFHSLIKEKNPFDENMLMLIASIGAFCLRLFGKDENEIFGNEFFEAFMVAFLFQLGDIFEDLATDKSHEAISNAIGLRAKKASLLKDGNILTVEPEDLSIGDEILVKVGEIIPADGVILSGSGDVDMSSLTGEFNPVAKKEGDLVNSGTILKSGSLKVRVNKSYEDSTVSKIIALVEESSGAKSKADKFITKFARIYTPIVVAIALLIAVIPPLCIGMNSLETWKEWIRIGVSILVISCPCAVVVSVPLAYFAGIGLASKYGIIVKGGSYFDELNRLGVLVTDKTGTLTRGKFIVEECHPEGISLEKFQEYMIAAESRSNHPIAKAIVGETNLAPYSEKISEYTEKAGYGEMLTYDGHTLLAGNEKLLSENHISFAEANEIGTIVYLAIDGKYAGYLLLNDEIKESSFKTIQDLHKMGVKSVMLTGDKKESALKVANELQIDEVHSELLPEDKTNLLKEKLTGEKAVAYVGDGINDAPSIALADIGVAMGGAGSDLAVENANIVIMNDDVSKIVTAKKIAKATRNRAIFNVVASLLIKLAIAACSILIPSFPLMIAVFADTGVTLLMVASSVSLLAYRVK